jgi:cholinesterase
MNFPYRVLCNVEYIECGDADMKRFCVVLAMELLLLAGKGVAADRPYSLLFVFGDSYSDTGAHYVDSNGPTAVAYLAHRLNIPFTYFGDAESKGNGLNFAVSGATTLAMGKQVEEFAKLVRSGAVRFDPQQTMFFFAGGLNDFHLPDDETATNIESEIETLYGLGARRFMVALLPLKIPAFAAQGIKFNPELSIVPAEMKKRHPDIAISNSSWGAFFDEVIEHPEKYGITDTTHHCAERGPNPEHIPPCAAPNTYFYYHVHHPSTATHKAVGDMLYDEALGAKTSVDVQ